jgi:hypothetical protein
MTASHTSTSMLRRKVPLAYVRPGEVRLGATIFDATSVGGRAP